MLAAPPRAVLAARLAPRFSGVHRFRRLTTDLVRHHADEVVEKLQAEAHRRVKARAEENENK
jgi:hypothetical protein